MSAKIPIGGELEAKTTEGIVSAASASYDYKKKKSQEQINAEVEGKLGVIIVTCALPISNPSSVIKEFNAIF